MTIVSYGTNPCTSEPAPSPMIDQTRSLKTNATWTLAGTILYAASQFLTMVILARCGGAVVAGLYSLAQATCLTVMTFADMQLRVVQTTDARNTYRFADYLGLRIVVSAMGLLVIGALLWLQNAEGELLAVTLALAANIIIEQLSDTYHGLFQKQERMDWAARSSMIRAGSGLIVFSATFLATNSLTLACVLRVVSALAVLICWDLPHGMKASNGRLAEIMLPSFERTTLISLGWKSFPIGMAAALATLETTIPRYLVQFYLGTANLGIFAALSQLTNAVQIVQKAMTQATLPRMARWHHTGNSKAFQALFVKLFAAAAATSAVGILCAVLVGNLAVSLVYGESFAQHGGAFQILAIASAVQLLTLPFNTVVFATNQFWTILLTRITGGILIGLISWWFIPALGINGAAYARLVTACVATAGYFVLSQSLVASSARQVSTVKEELDVDSPALEIAKPSGETRSTAA